MSMSVPKLRFKDNDGREFPDWRQQIISDIVKSLDAGVSVNSEDRRPLEDEYAVLKTSCVTLGTFDSNERKVVTELTEIKRLKEPLLNNSIVISRMNTPLLVGANSYIEYAPKKTFLPDRLWQIKIFPDSVIMRWLSFWFNNDRNLEKVRNLATGTSNSMKNITKPDLMALDILIPSIQEQTKIANFLTAIDEKITQLTQKQDLLKQYKKGVMQQIFSQKLRFKDDDGREFPEWEEKKLDDILQIVIDNRGKTPPIESEGFPLLEVNAIGSKHINYKAVTKYVSKETYRNWFRKHLQKNDVLFSTVGATAQCSFYEEENLSVIAQNIVGLRFKKNYLGIFMFYLLTDVKNNHKFKQIEMSAVQPSVKVSQMIHLSFSIPSLAEQTKIANFLTAIDDKITQTQTQLEAVKQYKKGLLQQMFV